MSNYDANSNIVKQVQTAINAQGYQPQLTVDGAYGPRTQAGVVWFQGKHGLTQDGIIGDATLAATISIPTPSGPALVPPVSTLPGTRVIHLHIPKGGFGLGGPTPQTPPPRVIPLHIPKGGFGIGPGTAVPAFHAPVAAKHVTWPTWVGLVLGTVAGTLFGGPPIGTAIGAAIGGVGGAGTAALINKKSAVPAAAATMHGEVVPFGCEVHIDESPIIAGDLGVPSKYRSMRG